MTITFGARIERDLDTITSKSFMIGNRLVLVNDGLGTPEDPPTFTVWDDQGNRVLAAQPFADATAEDLAGASFMGVRLPWSVEVVHVAAQADGGFVFHYIEHNPRLQFLTPPQPPSSVKMRAFSADGTPGQPSQPGIVQGNADGAHVLIDLPGGGLAEVWDGSGILPSQLVIHDGAGGKTVTEFTASGAGQLGGILAPSPFSYALALSGDTLFVIHQDITTANVHARRFGLDGQPRGGEIAIDTMDNGTMLGRPAATRTNAATLADGRVVVTWSNPGPTATDGIDLYQIILNADGSVARAAERINGDFTTGTQYDGLVFPLADGGYAVVYHTISTVLDANYRQEALARMFNADGTPATGTVDFPEASVGGSFQALNAHMAAVFPNGFGYMLDGFANEYTIRVGEGSIPAPIDGTAGPDALTGTPGNDTLNGLDGNDTLRGEAGNDALNGGAGNDLLIGGAGNDTLRGDAGNDTLWAGSGDDDIRLDTGFNEVWAGAGADTVIGGTGNDILGGGADDDRIDARAGGQNQLWGGDGNDTLWASANGDAAGGGWGNDSVVGGAGADTLMGGLGNDTVMAGDGGDILFLGMGDDLGFGEAGNDTLTGGPGFDRLWGGTGADRFDFWRDAGWNRIEDFDAGAGDVLALGRGMWTGTHGALTAAQVVSTFGSVNAAGDAVLAFGDAGTTVVVVGAGTLDGLEAALVIL